MKLFLTVATVAGLTLASLPSQAAGCLSGAAVGGVAGHVAGHHGVLGAAAGCAIGHHRAAKQEREEVREQQAQRNAPSPNTGSGAHN